MTATNLMSDMEAQLRERLAPLKAQYFEFTDDSHQHAGHAGAREGGHYRIVIVSDAFKELNTVSRHRRIYELIGDLSRGRIHALSIKALAPDEI